MSKIKISKLCQKLNIDSINKPYSTGREWGKIILGNTQRKIYSPINSEPISTSCFAETENLEEIIPIAQKAFLFWRNLPSPKRGDIIRQIGLTMREYKTDLARLISLEMGKIYQESLGEVQEMIDICDFGVGLSRQLYGFTMHSERPQHRMYEQYHPLGIVGIISAFNFPVAVWSWNAIIASICGNVCIWKPSEKTPLTAIACQKILSKVLSKNHLPEGIFNLIVGNYEIGEAMANNTNITLISATGSVNMGRKVAQNVSKRLGKVILELGGNNAVIITPHANIYLAVKATAFGALGTAGQRCTSIRRLIVHERIYERVKKGLIAIYKTVIIGNPLDNKTLVGPLIDKDAVKNYSSALAKIQEEGGKLLIGGEVLEGGLYQSGLYVSPAIVAAESTFPTLQRETFAPILYLLSYTGDIQNAIDIQNSVPQGLSSAIFSDNIQETEIFLSHCGSDCGIANVNIGTSGAEIGGAFGGEKDTGSGREAGSDTWKAYMRRQTNTINYGKKLPLAQNISFDIDHL